MALDPYDLFRPVSRLSVTKDGSQAERVILVRATTEATALSADNVPARGDTIDLGTGLLYCSSLSVSQDEKSAGDSSDRYLFAVTAVYATLDRTPVEGKARWNVNGQNQAVKVKAVADADHKVDYLYGAEGSASPAKGYTGLGINVGDKGADGVDVDDPYEVLRIDLWIDPTETAAKLEAIRALRNLVNSGAFEGPWGSYAAGEARLHTYQVSHVNGELDQVSIEFLCLKNVEFSVTLWDGTVHTVSKDGHEYYWQRMKKTTESGDDTKADVNIIDAHVDIIYDAGDFSDLAITNEMFDYEPGS